MSEARRATTSTARDGGDAYPVIDKPKYQDDELYPHLEENRRRSLT
uniref:Uncharacterized protein n=1 Tax=Caenorhabditis japonica TaxID=281687 RepID=A0A8R1ILN9_CAEJA